MKESDGMPIVTWIVRRGDVGSTRPKGLPVLRATSFLAVHRLRWTYRAPPARVETCRPLVMALVLSLPPSSWALRGWCLGKQYGWWNRHPAWLTQLTRKLAQAAAAREQKPKPVVQERSIPMTFRRGGS